MTKTKILYEKMDPIDHIHKRPDMYLGTLEPKRHDPEWVLEGLEMRLLQEPVYSDGLWRVFLEPISNVVDNAWRSAQNGHVCRKIMVDIDPDTAKIMIWNDGQSIPIEVNEKTGIYNPELIFGNLLTSSNYNDDEERFSSGRNGLGVKLTNVFSSRFEVECGDPERGIVYTQVWQDHMRHVQKPKIHKKKTAGYTCIRFTPDLSLFHMDQLDSTILGLFRKTCVDMSMVTGIPVFLNKEKIHVKSLREYASLYPSTRGCVHWDNNNIQKKKGETLEVVVCPSFDDEYHEVAFVNGIYNREGGAHADAVSSEFFRGVLQKINKGRSTNVFTTKDIRPHFMIFVKAALINPTFSNQNKTRLQSPAPKVAVEQRFIQTVCSKWGFMEKMNELMSAREYISLKKTEKKRGFRRIEGLDQANKAGGKESKDCTLILCEGLSAKTYAVKGITKGWAGKKGRDYFGVFPLRGKLLNVRNANSSSISGNKEITSIIQALNLKHKTDYTCEEDFNTLAYGKIMVITDADVDGLHIASLILNLFNVLFPSLLKRREPFIYWMMTPIAKIYMGNATTQPLVFYHDCAYQKKLEELTGARFKVKYYKGLGSSSDEEIRDTFAEKVVSFQLDKDAEATLGMVFSKSMADDRKRWMEMHDPGSYKTPDGVYDITEFVNNEHIRFSIDDCKRNIPNLCDGLKLSQRKILYTVFKRNLSYQGKSMKVAQLAGSVAELSNYHHGEQCLYDTIVKLAQDFVGSLNNVPLLYPDGQFGSRSSLGRDAANGRYIHTKMQRWTRILFPEEDDDLLPYTLDDGLRVEPDYYLPIIPLVLVNGVKAGIGSGWSSNIASHNPLEIVRHICQWLDNRMTPFPDLIPYCHGFTGRMEKVAPNKFRCIGRVSGVESHIKNKKKTETHRITEIPIDTPIEKCKELLEGMLEDKKIKSFKNYSSPNNADFHFTPSENFLPTAENLNLVSDINLTNIVLFNDGRIRKYDTLEEIFLEFCNKRYALYKRRKEKILRALEDSLREEETRHRFIIDVMEDRVDVFRKTEAQVEEQLKRLKYAPQYFPMLYGIQIRSFTSSHVSALEKKIAQLKKELREWMSTTIETIWKKELMAFMEEYRHSHSGEKASCT